MKCGPQSKSTGDWGDGVPKRGQQRWSSGSKGLAGTSTAAMSALCAAVEAPGAVPSRLHTSSHSTLVYRCPLLLIPRQRQNTVSALPRGSCPPRILRTEWLRTDNEYHFRRAHVQNHRCVTVRHSGTIPGLYAVAFGGRDLRNIIDVMSCTNYRKNVDCTTLCIATSTMMRQVPPHPPTSHRITDV